MKKTIFTICLAAISMCLAAQTDIQSAILKQHKAGETVVGQFTQVDAQPKLKKQTTQKGTYYFQAPSNMRMDYTEAGNYNLILEGTFNVCRNGKIQKLPIKNPDSKTAILRQTLLYAMAGQVDEICKLNKAKATCTEKGGQYICQIQRDVKAGINSLTLIYDKKTGVLLSIRLTEANGNYTEYSISDVKTGVSIDSTKWK